MQEIVPVVKLPLKFNQFTCGVFTTSNEDVSRGKLFKWIFQFNERKTTRFEINRSDYWYIAGSFILAVINRSQVLKALIVINLRYVQLFPEY